MVDELVLCEEDQPQIHHSARPLALSAVMDHFYHDHLLKIRLKQFIMQDFAAQ